MGKFCAFGDIDALRNNVIGFLNDPPAAELLETARVRYSAEQMYERYSSIYDELLKENKL